MACIGPAGEQGVAFATIASDGGEHHAGRGGAGTVLGARLEAVVVRGEPPTDLAEHGSSTPSGTARATPDSGSTPAGPSRQLISPTRLARSRRAAGKTASSRGPTASVSRPYRNLPRAESTTTRTVPAAFASD